MPDLSTHLRSERIGAVGAPPVMESPRIFFVCPPICRRLAMIFCLMIASSGVASLGTSRYATHSWRREDGLPQNSVTAVVQTRDGYLWLSTYNGLARFDGVRFTVFDNTSNPELRNSRITSLYEAPDGVLWIGHENGEVTRYRNGRFTAVPYYAAWSGGKICGMGTDTDGDVWLFNDDGLLARVRDGCVLSAPRGAMHHLSIFVCSPGGTLWLARDGLVSAVEHGRFRTPTFDQGRTNSFVEGIGLARDGGLWVDCNELYQKWKDDRWVGAAVECPWGEDPLTQLMETQKGLLAAATADRGLYIVIPDGSRAATHFWRANGFAADWIVSLMEDREANLWAATGSAGLAGLRPSVIDSVNPPDQWLGRAVKSVTVAQDGGIWAATEGAGVYSLKTGSWRHFGMREGVTNSYVWSVAEDPGRNLWAATWGGGLYENHGDVFRLAEGFDPVAPAITALYCEGPKQLWLGTARGLVHYDHGQATLIAQEQSVRTVIKDHSGAVWFGMSGGGLGCLKGGVTHYFGKADGLLSDFVQCLREDSDGTIWIGTFGGGLSRWKAGRLATISSREGLGDNVICDIEDDGLGYYWMSSYNGLLRVRKSSLDQCADGLSPAIQCDTFGMSDGMPTLECSGGLQPAGCATTNGSLWFATGRGLVAVHPAEVRHNPFPPPVMIEKVLVDGELQADGPSAGGRLTIPPGRHRLEFQYTGLSFAAPEKVRFKHRLDGLDASWIDAGTERHVDYNYIPPGEYHFQVIACNNDGVWSDPGATMTVTMMPHFWQTAWFRQLALLGLLLLVGGGTWYGTRLRMGQKVGRLEHQRAVERERARIARDIHDDLGASLTRINLLSQSAQLDIEDTPQHLQVLGQISHTARKLTRAMDEIVWAVDPKHDTLESLVSYLAIVVKEVFADANIRCRLDFPRRLPAWPLTVEVRHNLFLAFKEGLHNVLKHSGATEVQIRFVLDMEMFKVMIQDNGCGFEMGPAAPAVRNGLFNMRQRLAEINGDCEIQSGREKGTTVTLIVPITGNTK